MLPNLMLRRMQFRASLRLGSLVHMHRLFVPITMLCFGVSACTSLTGVATQAGSFSTRPYGDDVGLQKASSQRGSRALPEVTSESFREITVAQGSGLDGFETIRIFSDGTGYAVVRFDGSHAARVPLHLSHQQLALLLVAIQQDRLRHIKGMYSSGFSDGTQGFVELVTSRGRVYSWLDNYFEPVSNLFAFCNQHIWPGVARRVPAYRSRPQRNLNLQEECDRIFNKKT